MQIIVKDEWQRFRDSLILELKATPIADFEAAWMGLKNKTGFYGSDLLARVSERNNWTVWYEFLRCDFALVNHDGIPIVFIESENNHQSASEEIEKLCCVCAPLKVLLLSCSWYDSERAIHLQGWRERIRKQNEALSFDCVYAIVVGEWGRGYPDDGVLRYYIESFDADGADLEPTIEVEIPKPWVAPGDNVPS